MTDERTDALIDRAYGHGFRAGFFAAGKTPQEYEAALRNADRMIAEGRRALLESRVAVTAGKLGT